MNAMAKKREHAPTGTITVKTNKQAMPRDMRVFYCAVFFVLGFSVVFSLVGALLQSVLSKSSYVLQQWLSKIGGAIIIAFGLHLLHIISIPFLGHGHAFKAQWRFTSAYATAFAFGAAFAVGWTPCISPILGAVLMLASTHPSSAFVLMMAYTLGLGLPFLALGLFINQARPLLEKAEEWLSIINYFFGAILVGMGVLILTDNLGWLINAAISSGLFASPLLARAFTDSSLTIGVSFLAGLASFLSPCVLPLIPGFLAYLSAMVENNNKQS